MPSLAKEPGAEGVELLHSLVQVEGAGLHSLVQVEGVELEPC